jgi:hypothetical protein
LNRKTEFKLSKAMDITIRKLTFGEYFGLRYATIMIAMENA